MTTIEIHHRDGTVWTRKYIHRFDAQQSAATIARDGATNADGSEIWPAKAIDRVVLKG